MVWYGMKYQYGDHFGHFGSTPIESQSENHYYLPPQRTGYYDDYYQYDDDGENGDDSDDDENDIGKECTCAVWVEAGGAACMDRPPH